MESCIRYINLHGEFHWSTFRFEWLACHWHVCCCSQQVFSIKAYSGCQGRRWRSTTSRTPSREVRYQGKGRLPEATQNPACGGRGRGWPVPSLIQVTTHWLTRRATMTSTLWLECWSFTSGVWRTRCFLRTGLMTSSPVFVSTILCLQVALNNVCVPLWAGLDRLVEKQREREASWSTQRLCDELPYLLSKVKSSPPTD